MIRAFLISFLFGLLVIWTIHSEYQITKTVKHCEQLVEEIHQHAENLKYL